MSSSAAVKTNVLQGIALGVVLTQVGFYLWDTYSKKKKGSCKSDSSCCASSTGQSDSTVCAIGTPHHSASLEKFRHFVYADYNATTPVYKEVQQAMLPFTLEHFGNPSSSHVFGRESKAAVVQARKDVAQLVHAESEQCIVFTGCGTESDNGAIDIALHHWRTGQMKAAGSPSAPIPRVISSVVEHPGIMQYVKHLEEVGQIELVLLPVDGEGFVNPDDLQRELTTHTALVTLMHSNNEVGTIQNIRQFSSIIRRFNEEHFPSSTPDAAPRGVLFHSDAAQSLGKVHVDVARLGLDLCTIVGHKFGAPKGVGALYIRDGVRTKPLLYGGGQERGVRSGTENVLLIAGLGAAARVALAETRRLCIYMLQCKLLFITRLRDIMSQQEVVNLVRYNGPSRHYANYIPRPNRRNASSPVAGVPAGVEAEASESACAAAAASAAIAAATAAGAPGYCGGVSALADDIQELSALLERMETVASSLDNSARRGGSSSAAASTDEGERVALLQQLEAHFDGFLTQLPNTLSISFAGIKSNALMPILEKHVACSAGSACHGASAGLKMSDVLAAMKVPLSYGLGTLRVSFGRHTTPADVYRVVDVIVSSIAELRKEQARGAATKCA